jgi:hypothetical protein
VAQIAKTQKVKGLLALKNSTVWSDEVPHFRVITNDLELTNFLKCGKGLRDVDYPIFARPCPITPRHGFVDSTVVNSNKELKALWVAARKVDPQAEMILMKPVDCVASAILTENKISVGPSNDGATSGKNTVNLPLSGLAVVSEYISNLAGVKDTAYIEALFPSDHDGQFAVQLRDGPACKTNGNQIPKTTKVKKIVTTSSCHDLLAWESLMAKAKAGTVVYHKGGSPLSHYSVHAILNDIPVIFDKPPKIGSVLKASKNANKQSFPVETCKGIHDGFSTQLCVKDCGKVLTFAVMSAHHALAMMNDQEGSYLVGVGAALMVRLAYTACLGENRYFTHRGSRDGIYKKVLTKYADNRKRMVQAYKNFNLDDDDDYFDVGGAPWRLCAKTAIQLENSLIAYSKKPNRKTLEKTVAIMHNLINCTHNNGYLFDKFDGYGYRCANTFDQHADGDPNAVLDSAKNYYEWKQSFHVSKHVNPRKMKPVMAI